MAAVLGTAGAGIGLGVAAPANAATAAFNPLADYADWNVVTFGDTDIHAESEGAVAVGGDLSFTGTNVAFKSSAAVALLVGGRIALDRSSGTLQVNSPGSIKVGNLQGADVLDTDQNNAQVNTQVVRAGAGYASTPSVASNHRQAAASVPAPGLFAATFSQERAIAAGSQVAEAATGTCNADHVLTPSLSGGQATVTLTPGTNYWNVSAAELSSLSQITFAGAVSPSPENPLIVNVTGTGPVTMNLTMAGGRDPRGILFNLPDITSVTQGGDSIDGSILAPRASYTKTSANVQGTVIAASAELAGSEEHFFPFSGLISVCDSDAVITPTPQTTTPATPAPVSTTPATPAPAATAVAVSTPSATPVTAQHSDGTHTATMDSVGATDTGELAHTGSDLGLGGIVAAALLLAGAAAGSAAWWLRRRNAVDN